MNKKIILSPENIIIDYEPHETVLSALEKNGYFLPNNCRAGACGECKLKILDGEIDQGFILDMALSQDEKAQGMGLMCMAKIKSPSLTLEFKTQNDLPQLFMAETNRPYILIEKIFLNSKIVKLRLRSLSSPMKFWPGQYIMLSKDEHSPKRAYSIANISDQNGDIILLISRVDKGLTSNWAHQTLKIGDGLKIDGPFGTFIGKPRTQNSVLCLCHGSGLAPILSLTSGALLRGSFKNPVYLIFSAKTENDIIELGLLKFFEKKFRNFRFFITLTQEKNPSYFHGRINQMLSQICSDLTETDVYIAGSPEFTISCVNLVKELGAKDSQILTESFHSSTAHQTP